MRYKYYQGDFALDSDKHKRSFEFSRQLSQFRLDPSMRDVDSLIFHHRRPILVKWLEELAGPLDVLDLGGRIQPYRPLIDAKTQLYVGVDLQFEGMVDVIGNVQSLPFAGNSVDLVICTDTLQYVPDAAAAVEEMRRVLKPGGVLLLSTRGVYPEHHDELWRFLPDGLRYMARRFASVETAYEGGSGSGLMTALNVLLHRRLNGRGARLAACSTIPLLNLVGLALDRIAAADTRLSCGISMRAFK